MKLIKKSPLIVCAISALLSFAAHAVEVSDMAGLAAAISGNEDITLTTDIDCTGWTTATSYSGTIDGQGHAIKNLTTTFIDAVGANSTVKDLVIKDADLVYSGTLSGSLRYGLFANTFTGGGFTVSGVRFVNCRYGSTASLSDDNITHGFLAGAFGDTGTVSDCTLDSDCKMVFGNIRAHLGGLFGYIGINADTGDKAITVSRCANAAKVEVVAAKNTEGLGGLAYLVVVTNPDKKTCSNKASLSFVDCTNDVSVTFSAGNCGAGGFVYNIGDGNMFGTVSFVCCVNNGDLKLTGAPQRYGWGDLGGFVARSGASQSNHILFQDCINNGDVICEKTANNGGWCDCVGGFVGRPVIADDGILEFVGCANLGAVTGFAAGGFVGEAPYKQVRAKYIFTSCYQGGTLTALGEGLTGGECIGYLPNMEYKTFSVKSEGCLVQTENFIGGKVAGCQLDGASSITTTDNVIVSESDGLVSGVDLDALNAYQDCDLWKQGTQTPILKIMPDEPAPDVIEIKFADTEAFGGTVFKTAHVARGGWVYPPEESPAHDGVTFLGWGLSGEVVTTFDNLTADTTFVAVYQSGIIELTVRFFDWDGITQIGEDQTVPYGEAAIAPEAPEHEGYLFVGWDQDFSAVKESLDILATYMSKNIDIETVEDFAAVLVAAKYPDVKYHLLNDITIPSTFASIEDFIAGFDGEGHVIHMTSKFPLFKRLKGKVGNFILDGDNGGKPTTVTTGAAKYALVADDVLGGEIHDVVVRNFTMNTGDNCEFGLVAARLCDGGVIRRCLTESNCTFNVQKTQNVGAGAIVGVMTKTDAFAPMDEDGKPILGLELARVESCTNNAAICYYQARGQLYLGGIVGFAALDDKFGFTWTITNCVNNGNIVKTTANFNNARIVAGGILGYRGASGDNIMSIVDCVNTGNIMPLTSFDNSYIGGIIGMMGNTPKTIFRRNVNRGTIGVEKFPSGEACTTGCFGGLVGYGDDVGNNFNYEFADSANYGDIVGGASRGGLFGAIRPNSGGGCKQIFVNCANYGDGCQGEILGAMTTDMGTGIYRLNISNCFVRVAGPEVGSIVEQTNPQKVVTNFYGNVTPATDGYTLGKAVSQLNEYAEANGYEPWVKGKIDSGVFPELGIFCEKLALSGILMLFR